MKRYGKASIRRLRERILHLGSSITIRTRLFIASILLVFLAMVVFVTTSSLVGIIYGRRQVFDKLESVATLKEAELNNWTGGLQSDLATILIGDEVVADAQELLAPSDDPSRHKTAYDRLNARFSQIVEKTYRLDEIFMMNLQRQVVISTDHWREGGYGTSESNIYFSKALQGDYFHPPSYTLSLGDMAIVVARPVLDPQGQPIGILVGRTTTVSLSEIMLERAGLGETGETYLVNNNHIMMTEPRFPEPRWYNLYYVFTEGADYALDEHRNGSGIYTDYRGVRVLGVYHWLPTLEVALLAEQNEAEAMAPTFTSLAISIGVAVVSALIAGLLSLYLARTITEPLAGLVKTAAQVADGDLQQVAAVGRRDEIGVLAEAFNTMTERLRGLINSLEEQVKERTASLQWQTVQLETSTKVSREITSILDTDRLLARVVELIQQAFGYYHVGVYLVNEPGDRLLFMAGTGEVSRIWKAERQQLLIGAGSLNGEVALQNRALFANDVSQDSRFKTEEALPDTKSELVAPLRIGDRVLGTLDVQSGTPDAFRPEDVDIIQSLGDQVAIAIENARLYNRIRDLAVSEERQRLARELHDSVTQSLYGLVLFSGAGSRTLEGADLESTRQYMTRIERTANEALKEMRLLLYQLRSAELEWEGLPTALRQRLEAVEDRIGMKTHLFVEGELALAAPVERALYGIAQEALNNALRHSSARSVSVTVRTRDDFVELEVVDDGVGFDLEETGRQGGMGLPGMQERAQSIGATLQVESAPGQGTRVSVKVAQCAPPSRVEFPEVLE